MADYSTDKPYHRKLAVSDFATGTDGQVITYDANGNPTTVGPGTTGQVLTSAGAGAPQTFATPIVFNDNALKEDIALTGFKTAAAGSAIKHNLVDQIIDDFQDASGFDAGASTNELRNAAGKYVSGASNLNATGGTITNAGGYTYHSFTANGTFTPPQAGNIEVLMVAGGGGGGGHHGGGGGAGGVINDTSLAVTAQGYSLVVGAAGAGGATNVVGANGGASTGFGWTASGGGGGGGLNDRPGRAGGSGGGGSGNTGSNAGGATNQASGHTASSGTRTVYGFAGQNGSGSYNTDGCGGGAGGGGNSGSANKRDFSNFSAFGVSGAFAGGGGGGNQNNTGVAGGGVGAGNGGASQAAGQAATTQNTGSGGGGGGAYHMPGGAGASGWIGIRYANLTFLNYLDLTLVSAATTAEAVPTKGDIVLTTSALVGTLSIGNGLNGDIRAWVSRDGGSNWTQGTLVDEGDTVGQTILVAHDIDISSQPSGSSMKYKITTHNNSASKSIVLHAISLGWS